MRTICICAVLIVTMGGDDVDASCSYMDEDTWKHGSPKESCGNGVTTIREEQCNGVTRYVCRRGEEALQKERQIVVRVVLNLAKSVDTAVFDSIKCLSRVLCEAGCDDMKKYGLRGDDPTPQPGDNQDILYILNAYKKGQEYISCSSYKSITCNPFCSTNYPVTDEHCKKWFISWDRIYTKVHDVGMIVWEAYVYFVKVAQTISDLTELS